MGRKKAIQVKYHVTDFISLRLYQLCKNVVGWFLAHLAFAFCLVSHSIQMRFQIANFLNPAKFYSAVFVLFQLRMGEFDFGKGRLFDVYLEGGGGRNICKHNMHKMRE